MTKKILGDVIDGGYCVGCGACASLQNSPFKMEMDEHKKFVAVLNSDQESGDLSIKNIEAVCPFSNSSPNEDEISQDLFGNDGEHHKEIGFYLSTYAGYVVAGEFREKGSSGGMGTWITAKLLNENLIDGVIHIHQKNPEPKDSRLFEYQLSTTLEEVYKGAKSRYYPIEMSEVMELVRNKPGRYAIVGIPCYIKAVRLLMKQDAVLKERIKFCISLVCGHLKSAAFAEMFAWQCGIEPGNLLAVDFRKKIADRDANRYGFTATGLKDGVVTTQQSPVNELYGADWGLGFFKYKACEYCDDVVGETADLTVGDAWLPQYVKDSQGTNVIVVRNKILDAIIQEAQASGELFLEGISADDVAKSQRSGLRHRREGLAYRLYLSDQKGEWRPQKRVKPQKHHLDKVNRKRVQIRFLLAEKSHAAFSKAIQVRDFSRFIQEMEPLLKAYQATYQPPRLEQWKSRLRRAKKKLKDLLSL